jgi:hypothetical protein
VSAADHHLLLDLQGRGQRLREHRDGVGEAVRHGMEVLHGKDQRLGERAVARLDAQDRAPRAVGAPPRETGRARPAGGVDPADHPAAPPLRGARRLLDLAHELVAGDSGVRVVATGQLEVGVAHACEPHPDPRFTGRDLGYREVLAVPQDAVLQPQAAHACRP